MAVEGQDVRRRLLEDILAKNQFHLIEKRDLNFKFSLKFRTENTLSLYRSHLDR